MKKNKTRFIITCLLSFSIFLSAFYISQNLKQIKEIHRDKLNVLGIYRLSSEVDSFIQKEIFTINYDEINSITSTLDEIKHSTRRSNISDDFGVRLKNYTQFQELIALVDEKLRLTEEIKSQKSQMYDSLIYLSDNMSFLTDTKTPSSLYAKLILYRLGVFDDEGDFVIELSNALEEHQDHSKFDFIFLSTLSNLANSFIKLDELRVKNSALNIHSKSVDLLNILNAWEEKKVFYIKIVLLAILLATTVFTISQFRILFAQRFTKQKSILQSNIIDKISAMIVYLNPQGQIKYANDKFINQTCYNEPIIVKQKADIADKFATWLFNMPRKDSDIMQLDFGKLKNNKLEFILDNGEKLDIIEVIKKEKRTKFYPELIVISKDNSLLYQNLLAIPIAYNNKLTDVILIINDFTQEYISQLKLLKKENEIRNIIKIDKITELPNIISLYEDIKESSNRIVYISIYNYENIKFFHNNQEINDLLKNIGISINLSIKTNNIPATLYHLQDENFCLIYNGLSLHKDIRLLLSDFNASAKKNISTGVNIDIKLVCGISKEHDINNLDKLFQAKFALSKALSENKFIEEYDSGGYDEENYLNRQFISNTINDALNNDRVVVVTQPIFDVSTDDVNLFYYEVLVRIIDNNGETLYPNQFLPIAKKVGFYSQITKRVVEKTFELIQTYPKRKFSMNISTSDMIDQEIKQLIFTKLSQCETPGNLTIEFLETDTIFSEEKNEMQYKNELSKVSEFLNIVKLKGCHIALDDFGSGYSNFYRTLSFDIDYVKIDGSLISKLTTDIKAKRVVEAIVSFAKSVEYKVVAEFVSDQNILAEIKKLGIDYAQGYYLGKPQHINEYEQALDWGWEYQ